MYDDEIKAWLRMKRDHFGMRYCILDHVRLIKTRERFKDEFHQNNHVATMLSEAGKELDIAIHAIAHVKRGAGEGSTWPSMSDIKGTGNWEEAAESITVMGEPTQEMLNGFELDAGCAIVPQGSNRLVAMEIVANRNGPDGIKVLTEYNGLTNTWKERA